MARPAGGRRRGPRTGANRRPGAGRRSIRQAPWRQVRNPMSPMQVLSDDQIEHIHLSSLRVLEELGLKVTGDSARDLFRQAGADVDDATMMVRLDRGLVEQAIATVPSEFTLHARNPERSIVMGGNHVNFSAVGSAPNCSDLEGGRRQGTFADFSNFLRLGHDLNCCHLFSGYPVEPTDLPVDTRHLDAALAFITLTDRVWHVYSLGGSRIEDSLDMLALVHGLSRDDLADRAVITTVVNTNSPLLLDGPMGEGIIEMARNGQAVVVTPFTLSGAMSPVTLAGALTQQNAEALCGITLGQLARPGAPMMYGGFTSNVDMKSGAPAFGTPEYAKAVIAGGQLARRYSFPYRTSNVNASNAVDAQATWESEMSLWAATMAHGNLVKHSLGWLEGGLCASFEKMMIDAELLQHMIEFLQPIEVSDDTIAIEAMAEVGPGGHFFGCAHTLERYETAFYEPMLSDWRNFEAWTEAGGQTATQRANTMWKTMLAEYQEPPLDEGVREALKEFVEKRRAEIASG